MRKPLGHILTGSLTDGFLMRIAPQADLEEIKTGKFVSIVGKQHKFFSLITDLSLEVTHPDILLFPPSKEETLLSRALRQKDIYAIAQLKPMLMLNHKNERGPVKTVPPHFAYVYEASNLIFDMHSEYGLQARKEGSLIIDCGLIHITRDSATIIVNK